MGGEPSVAVDLVDTMMLAVEPPVDLLDDGADAWWDLQSSRLPDGASPDPVPSRRLRAALREVIEARIDGRAADPSAIDDLNSFADSVPSSPRLVAGEGELRVITRWHPEHGGNTRLAAIARDGISVLADPERSSRLRRCANPECSMVFLAENSRRIWCTPNICGNRARVARHYRRQHHD
jgi:predicted RNA-binding Zn ribbon-like protein